LFFPVGVLPLGSAAVASVSGRVGAIIATVVGATLIGFNTHRRDGVVVVLPRGGHGIQIRDLAGMALFEPGSTIFWCSSTP